MSNLDTNFIKPGSSGKVLFVRWSLTTISAVRGLNRHAEASSDFGDDWETGREYDFEDYQEGDFDCYTSAHIKDDAGKWHFINLEEGCFIVRSHYAPDAQEVC